MKITQKIFAILDQCRVRESQEENYVFSKVRKSQGISNLHYISFYSNNGNNDIVEIETPSSSRAEKVQTTTPATYYDEKKKFAEIR